jgi:beta-xylosidase
MPTYVNPVHPDYFADPFAWRHDGIYYAVGTGAAEADGDSAARVFTVLRSRDLAHWEDAGKALLRPDAALGDSFWAPEVAFHDGLFYLYYSVGFADKNHQLRVAISACPEGPYRDVGEPLIDPSECAFAIDAHPFQDDDGRWYLFYARDFLDVVDGGAAADALPARAGTAIAVAPLRAMLTLDRQDERVVMRARYDWQRFQDERQMYGGTYDWHTLEGPCVRKHAGRYYCFYSGGRWENDSYGVDYVVADQPLGPYRQESAAAGPRVLRTRPGAVRGPGHNSIVIGPDGRSEFVVYHAWDSGMTGRRMFIDRLLWTPDGPRCAGPTSTPQAMAR